MIKNDVYQHHLQSAYTVEGTAFLNQIIYIILSVKCIYGLQYKNDFKFINHFKFTS